MGSLFRAPTIEYVVEDVVRTHQADAYDMKKAEAPEKIIAIIIGWRTSAGLEQCYNQSNRYAQIANLQISRQTVSAPIFKYKTGNN